MILLNGRYRALHLIDRVLGLVERIEAVAEFTSFALFCYIFSLAILPSPAASKSAFYAQNRLGV